jgi:acetylornithine deacetylase/succinyl-diaminopimelate desuccinylase-like protein
MISNPSSALEYCRKHRRRFLTELIEFVRFPTVSAQPRHAEDIKSCAAWLADHLRHIGLENVAIVPTPRHPIVYGASIRSSGRSSGLPSDRPTVLVYGHYDVQPPEPLREWRSPPFDPEVRSDDLFGRGASDDKGQLFVQLKAIESYLQTNNELPVNVQVVADGEEEIGSPNLQSFLERNASKLASDGAVISDMSIRGPCQPAITYATRGQLSLELTVRGPQQDLHSGSFGGAIHNPLQALAEILARLHDTDRRVAIPGFYDRVRMPSSAERLRLARAGPSDSQVLHDAREEFGWGEAGYSAFERITLRPALTINGLAGGYQGPGNKGVIPSVANAKLSFRLVPDQNPAEIERLFGRHLARIVPPTVRADVRTLSAAKPVVMNPQNDFIRAAALAYRKGFGADPVLIRSGGTIPVISTIREVLRAPVVLMGFGLPDDHMHAPNEKFHLPNFFRGIETAIWFLGAVAASSRWHGRRQENEATASALAV